MSDNWNQDHQEHQPDHDQANQDQGWNGDNNDGAEQHDDTPQVEPEVQQDNELPDESVIDSAAQSNRAALSWRDAALITQFSLALLKGTDQDRETFASLVNHWGDPVDTARALYPSGGRIAAIDFITDLAVKQKEGSLSFTDGIQLTGQIGDMDPEEIRGIVRMVNTLTETYNPDSEIIRYRRNMTTPEVVNVLVPTVDDLPIEAINVLKWAQSVLAIWPGSAS